MKKTLAIYPERCTGCHSCEMVCSLAHDGECNLDLSRIGIIKGNGGGTNENIPVVCQQCGDPICADVCVMGAISRNENTGALVVDEGLCIGCKTCVTVCPLGGVLYHYKKDCSVKCDLCNGKPECVESCLYGAIEFVPITDWDWRQRQKGAQHFTSLLSTYR